MAQVPYNPVPSVPAEAERIRRPDVEAPPAAFGVNIAQGVEQAGQTVERTGDELFSRAMWLQNLANENAAREAQNNYALQASQLHADFGTKTGPEAKAALPGYLEAQARLRLQLGQGLNPMARKMYDSDSMPFMQRNVFSAAGHAADEYKKYTVQTYNAKADLEIQFGEDYPNDDVDGRTKRITDTVTDGVMTERGIHDPNDPIVKDMVRKALSKYNYNRINGMLRTGDIDGAEALFKSAKLSDEDSNRAMVVLEGRATSLYARRMVDSIYKANLDADGNFKMTNAQMQAEVEKQAKAHPELTNLEDLAIGMLDRRTNQHYWAAEQDQKQNNKQLNDLIVKGGIHDAEVFAQTPEGAELMKRMGPVEKAKIQDKINTVWDSIHKTTNAPKMTEIRGTRLKDPEAFLNIDPHDPKLNLSYNDIDQILTWQRDDSKTSYDDPRVRRAMATITDSFAPTMKELGLMERDKDNAVDHDYFTGALQEALTEFREDNGHAATDDEVRDKIAPMLFKTHSVKHWWRTSTDDPLYRDWTTPKFTDIPEAWKRATKAKVIAAGGSEPSDTLLYHAYIREQFNKLFGQSSGGSTSKPE